MVARVRLRLKLVCVRIVAPAEYASVWEVVREEVVQPVDTAARCPRLLVVSVQAMDGDDAGVGLAVECAAGQEEVPVHSTVGLAPSATTCKPCATAAAGPADAEDAGSSAGVYPCESAHKKEGRLGSVPLSCSSSESQRIVASRCLRSGPTGAWCRTEDA